MSRTRNVMIPSLATPEDDLRRAKNEWSDRLFAAREAAPARASRTASPAPQSNVVGVGVAEKYEDDQPTGVLAITFLVVRKFPAAELSRSELLPATVDGLPTDVVEVGVLRPHRTPAPRPPRARALLNPRTRIRPAQPGASVGPASLDLAGTFGALVTDGTDVFVLSNNHVLADENRLPVGSLILQPGVKDRGRRTDGIAELTRFVPLSHEHGNDVDAAIARAPRPSEVSPDVLYIGPPTGVGRASIDMAVHKFGRTTGYTVGDVRSVETDVWLEYETGWFRLVDQISIRQRGRRPFSDAGDSGSLILERGTNLGVGLLVGGGLIFTFANHLEPVLDKLQVRLVL